MDIYLRPTTVIDFDNILIMQKAQELTKNEKEVCNKAKLLFYFVRDEITYSLNVLHYELEHFKASRTLQAKEGMCIQKAVLLVALSRSVGIPARIHLAAIRNHLMPEKIFQATGGNILPAHGYSELYIEEKWVKVAPTFNLSLCQKNRFVIIEFDGKHDAVLPKYNQDGDKHIEYIQDRGYYDDLPFNDIVKWRVETFGVDLYERLKQAGESRKANSSS